MYKYNYRRTPLSAAAPKAVSLDAEGEVSLSVVKLGRDKVTRVDRYRSPGIESAQLGSWTLRISTVCSDNERNVQSIKYLWVG
jgi:hypothetical protein